MAVYSISDLEKLTGIKAHTLRAWEQRYGIVEPKRTPSNIRYYLDEDLRELLNVALLNKNGLKISKIAGMKRRERAERVAAISSINVSPDTQLDALTLSTVEMDEFKFGHIINTNISQRGFEETVTQVIYPFLDKLSVLYFTGSISAVQEAFISNLIRQKLLAETDKLGWPDRRRKPAFALYLPERERQELSILFVQYLLRKRQFPTLYFGLDCTPEDLADARKNAKFQYIFTILSNAFVDERIEQYLGRVTAFCPEATLLITGYQASLYRGELARVRYISGLDRMLAFMEALEGGA